MMAGYEETSKREGQFLIVAAIDFGTSYSGYAFSYKKEPTKVYTKHWSSPTRGITAEKIPTAILFDKKRNFKAFGFNAEEEYGMHCDDKKQEDWYFFKGYKLALYGEMHLIRNKKITDELGREFSLFDIVKETIKYLNDQLIDDCKKHQDTLSEQDVLRVITVPAIWPDSARQFMKKAAEEAGIPANLIKICLEPEAAAIYCKKIPLKTSRKDGEANLLPFQPGQKYLVLDAGGGTVDIVAHVVEENGRLRELCKACGGDWGGNEVDRAFIDFLSNDFGRDAFSKFKRTQQYDFMDLMRDFESKKRSIDVTEDLDTTFILRIPNSLRDCGELQIDKMRMTYRSMLSFYAHSKEKIKKKLFALFAQPSLADVNTLIMVGGFSDAQVLQSFIKEVFQTKTVIIPINAGTAVLKGAVMFGHDTSIISERCCRFTYGIKTSAIFDEKSHKKSKLFYPKDGNPRVKDLFDIHVKVGEKVKNGVFQPGTVFMPLTEDQNTIFVRLYASTKSNPQYTDEDGCHEINSFKIDISNLKGTKSDKALEVSLCFAGPVISVKAVKKQSGEEITHKIEFNWSDDANSAFENILSMEKLIKPNGISVINFGTSTCNCYFSFMCDFENILSVPLTSDICIRDRFCQPTQILFDKNESFCSFGIKAEEKKSTEKDLRNWFFFKHYKNTFYENDIVDKHTIIKDSLDRDFAYFKVISATLNFLLGAIKSFCKTATSFDYSCYYVLPVPITWSDSVRCFLKEAVQEAGFSSEQFLICTEAEAVLQYCRSTRCKRLSRIENVQGVSFNFISETRQSYIILNGGNNRVSLTAVSVNSIGIVTECRDLGNGKYGLRNSEEAFKNFLCLLCEKDVISENKEDLCEILDAFKHRSKSITKLESTSISWLRMPCVINKKVTCGVVKLNSESDVRVVADKLGISNKKMLEFHSQTLEQIGNQLERCFRETTCMPISTIIMVGEYCECSLLQNFLIDKFPNKLFVVPEMPGKAVVLGALFYGFGRLFK